MATGFPAATGDVLSAAMFNGLVAFTLNAQTGTTYTTRSEEHTSELQSRFGISYAVFCL